ncbi:MAG: hypothetical protein QNJ41_20245 [Xenococcaceae cyanobacterium MO_188.B32]|nr:hypothetical protein [Xenococcaceae cyanobacterium MO_188.B32]
MLSSFHPTGKPSWLSTASNSVTNSNLEDSESSSWDNTIKLWQLETGEEICTLREHTDKVLSIAIAPDGKSIISGSADNSMKMWQLRN